MLRMVSHSRRPQSGHITCYLNRTYHVLTTASIREVDDNDILRHNIMYKLADKMGEAEEDFHLNLNNPKVLMEYKQATLRKREHALKNQSMYPGRAGS